jgi:hypothetical protein
VTSLCNIVSRPNAADTNQPLPSLSCVLLQGQISPQLRLLTVSRLLFHKSPALSRNLGNELPQKSKKRPLAVASVARICLRSCFKSDVMVLESLCESRMSRMRLLSIARSRVWKSNLMLLRNQVNGRVVGFKDKYWWVKKSHLCLNCCPQDTKSVGSLSGAGVMAGKTAPPGCASTRYPFG